MDKDVIRVYAGFCDDPGVSRIGSVDVNESSKILTRSNEPVLVVGMTGTFDDNGLV